MAKFALVFNCTKKCRFHKTDYICTLNKNNITQEDRREKRRRSFMEGYVNALFTWIWFIGDKRKQALVSIFRVWMQTTHKYENLNPGHQSSSPSQATSSLKLGLSRTKLESKSRTQVLQHWLRRLTSQGIRWSREEQLWLYLGEIGPFFLAWKGFLVIVWMKTLSQWLLQKASYDMKSKLTVNV